MGDWADNEYSLTATFKQKAMFDKIKRKVEELKVKQHPQPKVNKKTKKLKK